MCNDKALLSDLIGIDLSGYILRECYTLMSEPTQGFSLLDDSFVLIVRANNSRFYCSSYEVAKFLSSILHVQAHTGYVHDVKIGKRLALVNTKTGHGYFLNRNANCFKIFSNQEALEAIESDEDAFIWKSTGKFIEAD